MEGDSLFDLKVHLWPIIYAFFVCVCVCILFDCNSTHRTIEHILLTSSDLIEIRESHFTAQSLCVLFKDISPEKIFNFLKERNILEFF